MGYFWAFITPFSNLIPMFKFFRLALCVTLCCVVMPGLNPAFAQTKTRKANVTEGPEVEAKRSNVTDICGSDETGYYTVRAQKKDLYLEHVNKQMIVDKSVKIPKQKKDGLPMYFSYCAMIDGNLYLFSTLRESRENKVTLYMQEVDKSTLVPDNTPKELAVSTYHTRRGLMSTVYGGSFSSSISGDESHYMVYSVEMGKDENNEAPTDTKFHLTVFDSKLAKKWEKDVRLPFAPNVFSVEQVKVDDNGDVFIIGIEYQEKTEARASRREGKPSYKYHLYRYSDSGKDVLNMPVELKDKFITDMQIDGAPNGDIVAAGFYSEKGTHSIKGAFYISIDAKTREIKRQELTEFETSFITQYYTEKEKKKAEKKKDNAKDDKDKEPELYSFRLDELLIREDGGATMVAEQYYMYVTSYTTYDANGRASTHTTYHYIYNDILVINFNANGSLAWKCKVPKRQYSTNDGGYYSSYAMATVDDKLYFIFNDNPKNLFLAKDQAPYQALGKEMAVVLVEVDASGNVSRELLMTTERGEVIVRPKMCLQTGEREVFMCSERGKVYQFAKVVFK